MVCMFTSCLWFSQTHRRSSCSEARSRGKPDLLRISSCSCTNPKCWLRCHLLNWSSMLLLHSETFVNLNVVLLQNEPNLASNKTLAFHYWSLLKTFPRDFGLLRRADFTRDVLKRTSEESALARYFIFELSKHSLSSSKFQAFRARFSP